LGGSAVAGPPFLSLSAFFVFCGGGAFFQGVLRKKGVLLWCFCGEVVDCVLNRGALMAGFWRLKKCHFLKNIFIIFLYFCEANG
jgi:hypothetical protein